jgi:hypothetical protein
LLSQLSTLQAGSGRCTTPATDRHSKAEIKIGTGKLQVKSCTFVLISATLRLSVAGVVQLP